MVVMLAVSTVDCWAEQMAERTEYLKVELWDHWKVANLVVVMAV